MPNPTKCSPRTQRVAVEMGSDLPKLDLLTVSLTPFYYFFSLSWPVVLPGVAFSTLPYCAAQFSPPLSAQVFSLQNFFITDLVE